MANTIHIVRSLLHNDGQLNADDKLASLKYISDKLTNTDLGTESVFGRNVTNVPI